MQKRIFLLFALFIFSQLHAVLKPDFSLAGFGEAATGGKGGKQVYASDYESLKNYAKSDEPLIIIVSGTIQNGADGGSVIVKSNKTILGENGKTLLYGVGFTLGSGCQNVIIRNLRITMTGVKTREDKKGVYSSTGDEGRPQILTNGGDCIRLSGDAHDVWIDHCELFSEDPDLQTNIDLYDGLIDLSHHSHHITLSWNYVHDHHKTSLVGSSERDTSDRKITYHHNLFRHCKDRLPLYRFGVGHIFNNYYLDCKNCINSRIGACLYVEKNVFENISKYTVKSISSKIIGYAFLSDNQIINSVEPSIESCATFKPSDYYDYSKVLTPVDEVKTLVSKWAGTGKLDLNSLMK